MVKLLFLPGTLCDETTFAYQVKHLKACANVQVMPLREGTTIHASARWILGQLERLGYGVEPFALVGFSQGAIVALEIMRLAPERVRKLCLISANPRASTPAQQRTWQTWQQEVRAGRFSEIIERFSNNVHPEKRSDPTLRETILNMAKETGPDVFITQLQALASRIDSRPHLSKIKCPTLLIAGRQDTVTPLEFHEDIHSLIPHSVLVPVETCGHYVPLEQPQAVTALLHDWLQQ
jgi:pimeloyl-ACP methyl ester carboxylesterase